MTGADFLSLMPLMIIGGAPVPIMLSIAFRRSYVVTYGFSVLAFIAAFVSLFFLGPVAPHAVSSLIVVDGMTILLSGIILLAGIVVAVLSENFLERLEGEKEEFFIILFVATLGSLLLVGASSFATLFLGLETLSVALYILIAYQRIHDRSIEAGVKYLILASVSSAFLLFGMGLIYTDTGSLEFSRIAVALGSSGYSTPLLLTGFAMLLVGIGFKLALVPFHMWTPDIYQGAPVPVTAFIATVSKGAVMGLFLRFFYMIRGYGNEHFIVVISALAILSMFVGNLLAIRQQQIKRILAYSSISNMGYLLVALLIGGRAGIPAAIFYIISYLVTTLGAFSVITFHSSHEHPADLVDDYRGLFWKRPWMALVFTLAMLSLAGIPLTTGFMAKFYLVFAGVDAGVWVLVIALIVNSVISLYYYLRVVAAMFSPATSVALPLVPFTGKVVLALIAAAILWLGILPQSILELISNFAVLN
jgi:NADH-quinone oxidoreductase subunit N